MPLYNCTPHPIVVVGENGKTSTYFPCGFIARLDEEVVSLTPRRVTVGRFEPEALIVKIRYQRLWDLARRIRAGARKEVPPWGDPAPGDLFVVSRPVAERAQAEDIVCPGDLVRDDQGRVIECKVFYTFAPITEAENAALGAADAMKDKDD